MDDKFWDEMSERSLMWFSFATISGTFLLLLIGARIAVDYGRSTDIIWTVTFVINVVIFLSSFGILWRCRDRL